MTYREKTTLILSNEPLPMSSWSGKSADDSRMIVVHNLNILIDSIHLAQAGSLGVHISRVIIDRSISSDQWLDFLTSLPLDFQADVLWVRDEKGYLSATGRTGDRVLHRLRAEDIPFYLEACGISFVGVLDLWTSMIPELADESHLM